MKSNNNIKTLDKLIEEQYGKKGTRKRDIFENVYETFKLDAIPKNGNNFCCTQIAKVSKDNNEN
jgi:hypothetical protein